MAALLIKFERTNSHVFDFSADNGFSGTSESCSIAAEFCEGLYAIGVTVTDPYGAYASASYILNVLPEENVAPVVKAILSFF
ncbi:MAG TPA: hypothetical protein EYN69_13295 [Flavobacteriales bacterium]|nr:hypothetical protein [Flavobacteriales bacterium]